jgi:hypothetical protein
MTADPERFAETAVLMAVLQGDTPRAKKLLDEWHTGELATFVDQLNTLGDLVTEAYWRNEAREQPPC